MPAGTFDCFRVDAKAGSSNRSYEQINSWSEWVCAAVKGIAKQRHEAYITSPALGGEKTTIDVTHEWWTEPPRVFRRAPGLSQAAMGN